MPAAVSYVSGTRTVHAHAGFALAYSTTYTVTLVGGGGPRIPDVAGNPLAANVTWTFTTAAPPPPPPTRARAGRSW